MTSHGSLTAAGAEVPFDEAVQVVLGYCLGQEGAGWLRTKSGIGGDIESEQVGAFAYATYDRVPGSPGGRLEPIDVLVADGLNAKMLARDIAGALAVAEPVSECLAAIEPGTTFWGLDRPEVAVAPGSESERAWPIWRAWSILMGVRGLDVARTHKILHHRRPEVFPLLDNETIKLIGSPSWSSIYDDLTEAPDMWEALEVSVNESLVAADGVALTRLRLHDILVWCRATDRWAAALAAGADVLDAS